MNKTTEEREVMPQFGGIGKNLGTFTVNPVIFTPETLDEACMEMIVKRGICHMLNSQAHINFGGNTVYKPVRAELEAKYGKPETKQAKEWHEKHHAEAVEIAKRIVPTLTFDYVERVKEWARTDFANRGSGGKGRPVLAQYDVVERFVKTKWDTNVDKRASLIAQLKLDVKETCDAAEMLEALQKAYQRPVVLDLGSLDEE